MDQDERLPDELAGAVAEVGVTAAGLPLLAPAAGLFTRFSIFKIREEHNRRVSVALQAAERISGMTREELGDAIADDPRLVPLVTRVLYAAGMSGSDRTLAAMGTALGEAVREPSRIDAVDLILTSLADLRGEHIAMLKAFVGIATSDTGY